jgi:rhodanese-related sulfurtransferase
MLFKIARLVSSKIIKGNYSYPRVAEISAEDLRQRIQSGRAPLLVDTRSALEFSAGFGHIPGAKHIPLMEMVMTFGSTEKFKDKIKELEAQLNDLQSFKNREVVTICPGGGFSLVAAEVLSDAGFSDVKSLEGGADGWFKKGFPTEKGTEHEN